jgi:cbb3-type cytochrome oxidase subunit 3
MWRELFSGHPATILALVALFFFIAVFVGVLVWVMNRKRGAHYRRMANLPVADDDQGVRRKKEQP